jgi:HD-GYP domain-containing protein (c-di-GMP phosphodiesterase class II)
MSFLIIGLICWLAIVMCVLGVLRAAGHADRAAERRARELGPAPAARTALVEPLPGRARTRRSIRAAADLPRAAAAVTLATLVASAQQLGGLAAVAGLAAIAAGAALAVVARRRGSVIERQAAELAIQRDTILRLALRLLALHDPRAARHAAAVAHHARVLACAAGLGERDQQIAHTAGLLHDIGLHLAAGGCVAGAPRPDTVDPVAIRAHPLAGAQSLRTVPGFEDVAAVLEAHHERIDGTGYPYGLRAECIPPLARILAIAEVYDVLTAPDSYRGAHSHERAAQELRAATGTQLDARLVELFLTATAPPATRPSLDDELIAARRIAQHLRASAYTG